jgi:hypothetical protein
LLKIQEYGECEHSFQRKEAGSIARVALKASLLNQIKTTFTRRSGDLEKSNVSARYKGG